MKAKVWKLSVHECGLCGARQLITCDDEPDKIVVLPDTSECHDCGIGKCKAIKIDIENITKELGLIRAPEDRDGE